MSNPHPNPRGPKRDKPFKDALRIEKSSLERGDVVKHPKGSLRDLAQKLLFKGSTGDIPAIKEVADRLDGKVPQAIVGDDDYPQVVEQPTDEQRAKALALIISKVNLKK